MQALLAMPAVAIDARMFSRVAVAFLAMEERVTRL